MVPEWCTPPVSVPEVSGSDPAQVYTFGPSRVLMCSKYCSTFQRRATGQPSRSPIGAIYLRHPTQHLTQPCHQQQEACPPRWGAVLSGRFLITGMSFSDKYGIIDVRQHQETPRTLLFCSCRLPGVAPHQRSHPSIPSLPTSAPLTLHHVPARCWCTPNRCFSVKQAHRSDFRGSIPGNVPVFSLVPAYQCVLA